MSDLDELGATWRAAALAAGCAPDDLDGPPRCFSGCGAEVRGVAEDCPACRDRRVLAERSEALKRAWATVPQSLSWVRLGEPQLAKWVRDRAAIERARQVAADLAAHPWITLVGEPGAGKTTLACAILREWVRRGARLDSTPAERSMARRSRFSSALAILHEAESAALGEHLVRLDLAREAGALVLDEVGRGLDRRQLVFGLLLDRHGGRKPTIMTTPHATCEALAAATGDGGLARRVFDDAVVIQVRKVAVREAAAAE